MSRRRRKNRWKEQLYGLLPQERFRQEALLDEQDRRSRPVEHDPGLERWCESSPGSNMQESPTLNQDEADSIARLLKIHLPNGHIPHIGGNLYSINGPVTPEMAILWLDRYNIRNRIPGRSNWEMLCNDVLAGRWIPTHQAFAFIVARENGSLTPILGDGQHRARGIHAAGFPVRAVVTINVLPESVRVMDTHMIRTVRTLINLGGKSMRVVIEGAVKFAILGPFPQGRKVSMNELWWFAQQYMSILDWVNDRTKTIKRNITLSSVIAAVVRAEIATGCSCHGRLDRFLSILQDGPTGDRQDDAAKNFREWLQTKRPPNMQGHQIYLRACQQIQLFLKGESSSQIRALRDDPYPLPADVQQGLLGQKEEVDAEQPEARTAEKEGGNS